MYATFPITVEITEPPIPNNQHSVRMYFRCEPPALAFRQHDRTYSYCVFPFLGGTSNVTSIGSLPSLTTKSLGR